MATGFEHRLRDGRGLYPALVLVAHQCLERDCGDGGSGADDHGIKPSAVQRKRHPGLCENCLDYRIRDDDRLGDCDVRDSSRVRCDPDWLLQASTSDGLRMEAYRKAGAGTA